MGFWNDKVLPRMIDRGMRNDFMNDHRHRAAPLAKGRVLEIGSVANCEIFTTRTWAKLSKCIR